MPDFYEFFAGGGMVRAGLGAGWDCRFANDFDPMKGAAYAANWGQDHLRVEDVNRLSSADLPGRADLAWASFPCQDLSLAGNGEGIGQGGDNRQTRSGTFWPFWRLMRALDGEGRGPALIMLENVYGALASNQGRDFAAIARCLAESGRRFGAMIVDARHFLPQSRPRLFILGVREDLEIPPALLGEGPIEPWHPKALVAAHARLPAGARKLWAWWNLPLPAAPPGRFSEVIEDQPQGVRWHGPEQTARLLSLMNPLHRAKLEEAKASGRRVAGGVYKRTRTENGVKVQRAEVRFDEVAGCLRTPSGGSSRQTVLVVEGQSVRSRLLSAREAARLMGLPESYQLPARYNDAYHLAGDGVAVPVAGWLARHLMEPILAAR